jgi:hypothetical protein
VIPCNRKKDYNQEDIQCRKGDQLVTRDSSNSDENNNCNQCYICFDSFQIGDSVSWSKDDHNICYHVFHSHCIMTWLENHSDCPCCRERIICDPPLSLWSTKTWRFFQEKDYRNRKVNAIYCIHHGLVLDSADDCQDMYTD